MKKKKVIRFRKTQTPALLHLMARAQTKGWREGWEARKSYEAEQLGLSTPKKPYKEKR